MECSMPGFSVHHQLLELAQTHVHRVGDAIQPFHPQSSPYPPAFNLSQQQGLFKWLRSLHQVAKVLEFQLSISPSNEYSGLISFRTDWISLQSKGLSRVFSNTTVQKHQFFGTQLLLGFCHTSTWISHAPLLLNIPPTSHLPSHPTLLGCHRTWVWAPWVIQHIPTGNLFYIW